MINRPLLPLTCIPLLAVLILAPSPAQAQAPGGSGILRVKVESEGVPLHGARIRAGSSGAMTDAGGGATLRLPAGSHRIEVHRLGHSRRETSLVVFPGMDTSLVFELRPEAIETEGIVVLSTRTGRGMEDEPVRVEVLAREEIEEKMLMTPGDISMMLNETSGLRVQTTSPSLGGANVRIQGLRGRYTQVLSDGLPLHGAQSGRWACCRSRRWIWRRWR